ncbi:MAG: MptD family putative ECF transporter S component [Corynebacterium sp.]|uniref:MptD family putative ECF transporter S component n=1 Tax=Corynebacterium sp. TaxID=1720 RepID=UPI0026493AAA|nr:MptD family putative ECF transporter S component [Corynebacterium sp.]MDN5722479.1 MptD family putative ECF transporter S component [Corynebacterium sp.]MDN6283101.1 MptD family putative ECF transporter S component [Corynebacterium sp.]MDN6306250.1 MptD family putative ECF transporter S component [Corynebacterium sp.]MDN6351937.1 MptD family putative ECF transporter S component [Corynebacterium sp.]MDN6368221.1 MptD family putative ECF transporter S component [Corynebacterium sp.]
MSIGTTTSPRRTSAKNLVNVGVFTAVYFVLFFACGMIGIVAPVAMFFGWAAAVLLNGVVIMLYVARTRMVGSLALTGLIIGILMVLTGHVWYTAIVTPVLGLVADLIIRAGMYRSVPLNCIGYAVFSLWYLTPIAPFFLDSAGYHEYLADTMGTDYADRFLDSVSFTLVSVMTILIFLLSLVAAWLGMRMLTRHFTRAGVAGAAGRSDRGPGVGATTAVPR